MNREAFDGIVREVMTLVRDHPPRELPELDQFVVEKVYMAAIDDVTGKWLPPELTPEEAARKPWDIDIDLDVRERQIAIGLLCAGVAFLLPAAGITELSRELVPPMVAER